MHRIARLTLQTPLFKHNLLFWINKREEKQTKKKERTERKWRRNWITFAFAARLDVPAGLKFCVEQWSVEVLKLHEEHRCLFTSAKTAVGAFWRSWSKLPTSSQNLSPGEGVSSKLAVAAACEIGELELEWPPLRSSLFSCWGMFMGKRDQFQGRKSWFSNGILQKVVTLYSEKREKSARVSLSSFIFNEILSSSRLVIESRVLQLVFNEMPKGKEEGWQTTFQH